MHKIGIDIIEISRIKRAIERFGSKFLDRIFTKQEQGYCQSHMGRYAARFAVKEAVIKVLETGISFRDIEVLKCESGAIKVKIVDKRFQKESEKICISLTHSRDYAAAVAMYQNYEE